MPSPLLGSAARRWLVMSLLLAILALASASLAQDVIPLRRVLLSPERLPREMERLKQGLLVQLPRAEFEDQVRQAQRAADTLKNAPRLTESRYQAVLSDSALVGVGRWQILHPGPTAALLPLPSWNLTLRGPPRSNKGELALGEFDGKMQALLLSEPGTHHVDLEWSARADSRPDGLTFDLEIPPSPVTAFDLVLPHAWVVSVPEGILLTGPRALSREGEPGRETLPDALGALVRSEPRLARAVPAGSRLWTIHCGRVGRLRLTLRPTDRPGPARLLVQQQQTTQTLFPDALEAEYKMDLEALHKGVRELVCECDPGLRPYAVSLPNLERWDLHTGPTPEAPAQLVLHLKEVLHEGTLRISCLAPLRPAGKVGDNAVAWTSPGVRVRQAVPRGETLLLKIHPDLRLEGWNPGGFRLTPETATPLEPTGPSWQRLTLVGGGVTPEGQQTARPSARLQAHAVEYRARQLAWWQPTSGRASLTLQIHYEVEMGQLFQLPVQLPAGWDLEQVEVRPAGLFGSAQVGREKDRAVLLVDLLRPLSGNPRGTTPTDMIRDFLGPALLPGGRRGCTLTITLGASGGTPSVRRDLPFPEAIPLGARLREGVLAIGIDTAQQVAEWKTTARPGEPGEDGPWGKQIPTYSFPYREQPPHGTLILRPRVPELRARCRSAVSLAEDRATLEAELNVEVEAGNPETVDLFLAGDASPRWTWKAASSSPTVVRAERLPAREAAGVAATLLGAGGPLLQPLALVTAWTALPQGQHWRLTLSRPLRPEETVRFTGSTVLELKTGPTGKATYRIPLLQVPGAPRLEGEVQLYPTAPEQIEVISQGLRELAERPAPEARGPSWRQFRYGPKPVRLELVDNRGSSKVDSGHGSGRGQVWDAQLTSWLGPDDALLQRCTFRLTGWGERTFPVRLPAGSRLLAAAVNGHWIDSPGPSDTPESLELPVPRAGGDESAAARSPVATVFEIVYVRPQAPWRLWAWLEADAPELPLEPINLRRCWQLPPGILPLRGGDRFLSATVQNWRSAWSGNPAATLGPRVWVPAAEVWRELRKGRSEEDVRLAELIESLSALAWKEHRPLVVDLVGLGEAGLERASRLADPQGGPGRPSRDNLGVVPVLLPSAIVVTTPRQLHLWQGPSSPTTTEVLERWLKETIYHGHEGAGRFRLAQDYLADPNTARFVVSPRLFSPGTALAAWSTSEAGANLVVVRGSAINGLAIGLSILFLGLFLWGSRAKPGWRLTFLWFWLAGAGLVWFWLPVSLEPLALAPLLTGLGYALVGYLSFLARLPASPGTRRHAPSTQLKPPSSPGAGIATALVLVTLAAWSWAALAADTSGSPATPGPFTVYLLPEKADAPGEGSVLATPELLDHLKAVQNSAQPGTPGQAVLVGAAYEGKLLPGTTPEDKRLDREVAQIDAVFQVLSLHDNATVVLPLEGVYRVGPVWLDNEGATPLRPAEGPRERSGFAIAIPKAGRHKVEMHFQVQVHSLTDTAADRTIQLTLPPLATSRLRFQSPVGAVALQALNTQGWQRLTPGEGTKVGPVLEIDVGRANGPLQVTWYQDNGTSNKAGRVQFQEAYLWDLRGDASSLSGLIHYRITRGTVRTLSLDLPAELEVRGADAFRVLAPRPATAPGDPAKPPRKLADGSLEPINEGSGRLSGWRVEGKDRGQVLHLDFQGPANGDLAITLDLVPRTALPATVQLPLPVPRGEPLPGTGFLAYRALGIEAVRQRTLNVTGSQPADFAPFWPTATRPPEKDLQYCCTFRREPGTPPLLQLHLSWPTPVVHVQQEVELRVGLNQVEVRAKIDLAMPKKDLGLVQWEVHSHGLPWTVAAVSGPNVRRWSQEGQRLLIWLDQTSADTRVELAGWLTLAAAANRSRLELPTLSVQGASTQKTTLRLLPEPALVLSPEALRGLRFLTTPGERVYQTEDLSYGGTVVVQATGAAALVRGTGRLLTFVELVDRQLQFSSTLVYRLRAGETRSIQLRLRDWDGHKVELQGAGLAPEAVRSPGSWKGEQRWTVDLPPGTEKPQSLTLRGQLSLAEARLGTWMPEVNVQGLTIQETWLIVTGKDLTASGDLGLVPAKDLTAVLAGWRQLGLLDVERVAFEAQRLRLSGGTVWRGTGHANLRVLPAVERVAEELPLRLLLGEQSAAIIEERYWLHEANWWIQQQGRGGLTVLFPAPVQVLTMALDGVQRTPIQPDPWHLRLPMTGPGGVRQVRLRFRYEAGSENLTRPRLEPARLEGALGGLLFWTVHVPAGYTVTNRSSGVKLEPGRTGAARLALSRAAVQEQILTGLAERSGETATEAERSGALARLARYCRAAERDLELADAGLEKGPDGRTLGEWLTLLQNRLRQGHAPPAPEEEPVSLPGTLVTGTPYYGWSSSWATLPEVTLASVRVRQTQEALLVSAEWLGLLVGVWFFSMVPYVPAIIRLLWPEQIALAAVVVWQLGAGAPVSLVVLAVALLTRLMALARWWRRQAAVVSA